MNWDAVGAIAANLRHPGIRAWWSESRAIYADEFETVVDELLRQDASASSELEAAAP